MKERKERQGTKSVQTFTNNVCVQFLRLTIKLKYNLLILLSFRKNDNKFGPSSAKILLSKALTV